MPPRAILALMEADRRRLLRDGLMVWMMILPLVMAAAARAGLPELVLVLEGRGIMIGPWVPQLRAVAFTVVVPVLIGVVVGFMLLEEKQDRVWRALAVTGVRLRRYLVWRAKHLWRRRWHWGWPPGRGMRSRASPRPNCCSSSWSCPLSHPSWELRGGSCWSSCPAGGSCGRRRLQAP